MIKFRKTQEEIGKQLVRLATQYSEDVEEFSPVGFAATASGKLDRPQLLIVAFTPAQAANLDARSGHRRAYEEWLSNLTIDKSDVALTGLYKHSAGYMVKHPVEKNADRLRQVAIHYLNREIEIIKPLLVVLIGERVGRFIGEDIAMNELHVSPFDHSYVPMLVSHHPSESTYSEALTSACKYIISTDYGRF